MASVKKMFKDFKGVNVLLIIGLVFLVIALYQYSQNKNVFQSGMTSMVDTPPTPASSCNSTQPPKNKVSFSVENGAKSNGSTPSSSLLNKPSANPSDLLPNMSMNNNEFSSSNPNPLSGTNFLSPHASPGLNTQGSSLRNPNLQLRSEPPNPRTNTNCPWNVSTIQGDPYRRPLEIGTTQ
tara:strand:+ start:144 stop:683 length:540 start_codon:yes stop_codon:yes gene_type:complete